MPTTGDDRNEAFIRRRRKLFRLTMSGVEAAGRIWLWGPGASGPAATASHCRPQSPQFQRAAAAELYGGGGAAEATAMIVS